MENKENYFADILEEKQNEKLQTPKKKKGLKGIIIASVAILLAGAAVITSYIALFKKKNNNLHQNQPSSSNTLRVENLGMEEELVSSEDSKLEYGETTGNIKKEDLVEENGTIWKDEEALENSKNIGKETIDDKNGTLVVKPNGDVFETEEDYIVKDESGNTITNGSNQSGIPENDYVYDENLNSTVKEEDLNKFVYVDANYYNSVTGELVYAKGEKVLKETLEKIKNDSSLTTTKPEIENNISSDTQTNTSSNTTSSEANVNANSNGVVNEDGTYTIFGITYMDKSTFESFLIDENSQNNFGFYGGVVYPKSVIDEMNSVNQK